MMPVVVVAIAVVFALIVSRVEKASQVASVAAWVGLVGMFVALQQGLVSSQAFLIATVCLCACAAFPVTHNDAIRKVAVWGLPVVLAPLAFFATDSATADGHFVVLVVAALGATMAGVASFAASNLAAGGRGLALAAAASFGGAAALGLTRNPVMKGFSVPLTGTDGPVLWELSSLERLPEGVRLLGTVAAPEWLVYLAAAAATLGVIAAVLKTLDHTIPAMMAAAAAGLSGIAGMWSMWSFSVTKLPDTVAYIDYTRLILQSRQIDPVVAENAAFINGAGVHVDSAALSVDFALWGLGVLLLVAFALRCRSELISLPAARDLAVRGVAFVWLGWFLTVLFHGSFAGSLGFHAPGEWMHLGAVLMGTAVTLLGWRFKTRGGAIVLAWSGGLAVAVFVLVAAVAWAFGAVPGFSVSLG